MNTWKLVKKEVLHKDFWNSVNRNTYELPNGKLVKEYIVLECRPVAMIFAVTQTQKIILIKEYKPGSEKVVTRLPAGYIEDNEAAEHAAKRELMEETGHKAKEFKKLGSIYNASGKMSARVHCFIALDAEKVEEQHLDEQEDIEILQASFEEALALIDNGTIDSADSVSFIQMGIRNVR